jgi:hypothetical protein
MAVHSKAEKTRAEEHERERKRKTRDAEKNGASEDPLLNETLKARGFDTTGKKKKN